MLCLSFLGYSVLQYPMFTTGIGAVHFPGANPRFSPAEGDSPCANPAKLGSPQNAVLNACISSTVALVAGRGGHRRGECRLLVGSVSARVGGYTV